ncbi:hypothetical protein EDC01DRAFT_255392 [Geopyxis carbonaria]|nr:hypothetical protein EDC01DRAFT_255392 [Geopyxis carbonaria]
MSGSTPNDNSGTASSTSPPPSRRFFETVRRFTDMQIATFLHSLIGLPSTVAPPNARDWVIEDSDVVAGGPGPHAASDSNVIGEVHRLQENTRDGKDGSSGSGSGGSAMPVLQKSSSNTGSTTTNAQTGSRNAETIAPVRNVRDLLVLPPSTFASSISRTLSGLEIPKRLDVLQNEAAEALVLHSQNPGARAEEVESMTELDAYRLFESLDQYSSLSLKNTGIDKPKLVHLLSDRRLVTEMDGSTRT